MTIALKIVITGRVQGVGFRPAIFNLCNKYNWYGYVKNTASGVEVVVTNSAWQLFINELDKIKPPHAQIQSITWSKVFLDKEPAVFVIKPSEGTNITFNTISGDIAICKECLTELFNPQSNFYLHPFISCSNCGCRYSITYALPYDRQNTTFDKFTLCSKCKGEYDDPRSRRYYVQGISCRACGPSLDTDFSTITSAIKAGKIVALKGISGYHLIVDAKNFQAVAKLREHKKRQAKPLALMVPNLASASNYIKLDENICRYLTSSDCPIVIASCKLNASLPSNVAPNLRQLGVMLPNSAIEHLLFYYLLDMPDASHYLNAAHDCVLVVTSANLSGESIIFDDQVAVEKLDKIADIIVSHNLKIVIGGDDSVIKPNNVTKIGGGSIVCTNALRLGRGFMPQTFKLATNQCSILALGSIVKNTICVTKGDNAYVSQYIGDVGILHGEYYLKVQKHICRLLDINPKCIALDLHPDSYADDILSYYDVPLLKVQHHFAHMAAVIGEMHIRNNCIGLILDGYGYGLDGGAWGGELLHFAYTDKHFSRVGHLQQIALPGGDIATKQIWRIALGLCVNYNLPIPHHLYQIKNMPYMLEVINKMPLQYTSSCGRLFDGVSALANICIEAKYEAEAAILLEDLVTVPQVYNDSWDILSNNILSMQRLIRYLATVKDAQKVANIFIGSLAMALSKWLLSSCDKYGIDQVILSGGCYQNNWLLHLLINNLNSANIKVNVPQRLAFNDNSISFGQAVIAAWQI